MKTFSRREAILLGALAAVATMATITKCSAQEFIYAPRIDVGYVAEGSGGSVLRQTSADGKLRVLTVDASGNVVFAYQATVDFAGLYPMQGRAPGSTKGFVLVFVNGEPALLELRGLPQPVQGAR